MQQDDAYETLRKKQSWQKHEPDWQNIQTPCKNNTATADGQETAAESPQQPDVAGKLLFSKTAGYLALAGFAKCPCKHGISIPLWQRRYKNS